MHKCPKCHGAGFTLHQVAWSMDRVRILCKTCDGIGYIYRKIMTPTQRKQLAQILLKEGEEGWMVTIKHITDSLGCSMGWFVMQPNHTVDHRVFHYKAERIERVPTRTPLPIEHYRRGMEVALGIGLAAIDRLVVGVDHGGIILETAELTDVKRVSKWRWPNETEWKPAYTETVEERVVETLIVEGL